MKKNGRNKSANEALNVRSLLVPIVFCLVCGILLIVLDNLALLITAYVLAGVMLLCGGWYAVQYLRSSPAQRIREIRLASGLILLVAGILLAFNPGYLESILPFVWGLALLFGGSLKIQYAFDEYSLQVKKWWIMLILAALSIRSNASAFMSRTSFFFAFCDPVSCFSFSSARISASISA